MIRKLIFIMAICGILFISGNAQNKSSNAAKTKTEKTKTEKSKTDKSKTAKQNEKDDAKSKDKLKTIYEGKGIEGITVGKSTMGDVVKKFGKYRWEVNKKYSYQMTYDKLGLSFYVCQSDKLREVFLIEIKSPYKAKTSKGVILGKSTKEETEKIYGTPKDGFEYRGVNFYYNKFGSRSIISEIDVTENSGIRQCKVDK